MLSAVLDWLKAQKKRNLKALLAEHTSSEGRPTDPMKLTEFYDSSGMPCICDQCPKARPRIFYILWSLRNIELLP